MEEVPAYTKAEVALLGCNDRFFLLTSLLNRVDMVHPWIYERVRMLEANPDGYLDLWARYHGKSSCGTFAGCISEILHNPESKIAIFSGTKELARPFVRQVKEELEGNETLADIYEDVLWREPIKQSPLWTQDKLIVKREGHPKEATLAAYGLVNAMPTGSHFDLMVFDDLVTQDLVDNPDIVKKVTQRWELADNLGTREGSRKWHFGTPYSHADTYTNLMDDGRLIPRPFPATEDGTEQGEPVFLTRERLAQVRKAQPSTFGAQMLLNPSSSRDAMFRPDRLRPFTLRPRTINVYIIVDPSAGRSAKSDRTAMVVIGIDANKNFYLLDGYCHRMRLSERYERLKMLWTRWHKAEGVQLCSVGYERYGMQADIEHFQWRMQEKNEPVFDIAEINWPNEGDHSKKARVGRLEADFENNKFYIPAKVYHPRVRVAPGSEEYAARTCLWSISAQGKVEYRALPVSASGVPAEIRGESEAIRAGEKYRLMSALRRSNEERTVYDLTRIFIDEYLAFPAPQAHDDLIDAVSRIHDMSPVPSQIIDEALLELPHYID
jgi:hypothetical protein